MIEHLLKGAIVSIMGCFVLLFSAEPLQAQTSIMSFNIRYDNKNDGDNRWDQRKKELSDLIQEYEPDVFGIQEGLNHQVKYLDSVLLNYNYVGVGRDDGKTMGEFCAIFYKRDKFKVLDTRTYWLSETPSDISVGWDASMERIVTMVKLKDFKTNRNLCVFNAHFDHRGVLARKESAKLILNLIKWRGLLNDRLVVLGDFNAQPDEDPIAILTKKLYDAYLISDTPPDGPFGTFNGFDLNLELERRIDYIMVKNLNVKSIEHVAKRRSNNLFISDHLPVFTVVD